MAKINGIDQNKLNKIRKEKAIKQQEELKKLREKPSGSVQIEHEHKEDVLSIYKNMSEEQKLALKNELQKRKVKESYINYLKYVYPDFIITKFHSLLANICQSVVEKIENGQTVRLCISVPPQHGKLLADNTPIFTKNGWKKHGDLVVGDYVLNHKGEYVKVTNVFPKNFANCKVTFTNGEEILCNENHEWLVYDRFAHKETIRETKFMENRIVESEHRFRFQIPLKDIVKGETKDLVVNPYVLGVWLGDGTNTKPVICACREDRITIDECEKFYNNTTTYEHIITKVIYKSYLGLRQDLQKYGMCFSRKRCEKYIPFEYLGASIDQRLELLAGLLDTDGHLDRTQNRYVFVTSDIKLKETFEQLIATFGWRTTTYTAKPTKSSFGIIGKKVYWQIAFNPTCYIPCRIPRKQLFTYSKRRRISICKIERIKEKQGNCIEVDGGIYLCGKTMIPTHNSTVITKTLPSWYVGRNPKRWAILTAYNADLAEEFSDNNRQLIKNYGKDIFGIEVNTSQDNKTLFQMHKVGEKETPSSDSGIMGVGIQGGIVGHGGSLIIIDDPYKNSIDADNKTLRDTISNVFKSAVLTRARGEGNAVIVIHTRWHDDDLIGELVKTGDWLYINIPAEWEKGVDKLLNRRIGETLCPELGFDSAWLERTKKAMGKKLFNANYQGKPFIDGGNIIKRDDIQYYTRSSRPASFEEIVLSCDLSFGGLKKDNDPYCMTLWGRNGGDHYLLKIFDKRASFKETIRTIQVICGEYPQLRKKLIEARANGRATIEMLTNEISGIVPYDPKNISKEDRLNAVSPYFESHNVYFPSEEICKDIEDYIEQLLKFPNTDHDDFVDTISQYLLNYEYRYGGRVETNEVYSTFAKAIRGF